MTIIKKFEPEPQNQGLIYKSIPKRYIWMISLALFMLVLIEIWVSNTVISYGGKFEKLSSMEKSLKMENQLLENEIAKRSSLSEVASKSAELGFSSGQSIKYIR